MEPRRTGRLAVSGLHELYWEESGHPDGIPVVLFKKCVKFICPAS